MRTITFFFIVTTLGSLLAVACGDGSTSGNMDTKMITSPDGGTATPTNNEPPQISFIAPTDGQTIWWKTTEGFYTATISIPISAEIEDDDGIKTASIVEFSPVGAAECPGCITCTCTANYVCTDRQEQEIGWRENDANRTAPPWSWTREWTSQVCVIGSAFGSRSRASSGTDSWPLRNETRKWCITAIDRRDASSTQCITVHLQKR